MIRRNIIVLFLVLLALRLPPGSVATVLPQPLSPGSPLEGAPLILSEGRWRVTSPAVNHFTAILSGSEGETWLGTPLGIKRVTSGVPRLYTTRDGLPPGRAVALAGDESSDLWCAVVSDGLPRRVQLCRLDRKRDWWIPAPSPRLPQPAPGTQPSGRLLLSVSQQDVFLVPNAGQGPLQGGGDPAASSTAFWRFTLPNGRWQAVPWPGVRPRQEAVFLQSAPGGGVFVGSRAGLLRWQPRSGWATIVAGESLVAGIQESGGDWWLLGVSGASFSLEKPELLHISSTGVVRDRYPFPSLPDIPRALMSSSGFAGIADVTLVQTRYPRAVWAVCTGTTPLIGSDMGGNRPRTWMVRFDLDGGGASRVQELAEAKDIIGIPESVLRPLLIQPSDMPTLPAPVAEALTQRFSFYQSPPSQIPLPPPPAFARASGEGGGDADGGTWDRSGKDLNMLVRTDRSGRQETFPLPEIRLPVSGDLAGAALTADGSLLVLTRDSLLRHRAGAAEGEWELIPVATSAPASSWLHYGYASRLAAQGKGFWLATDAFALPSDGQRFLPTVSGGGQSQNFLGVRHDGSAWIQRPEGGVQLTGADGVPVRHVAPAAWPESLTPPLSPLGEVGGVLGDVLWYSGARQQADDRGGYALVGYDTRTEKWTPPLPCSRVIALRSGSEDTADETLWALIEEGKDAGLRLYRLAPAGGAWEVVGSPLPREARINSAALRLVRARSGDIWIVDRDRIVLYHGDGRVWSIHAAPRGSGILAGNTVAEAGVYAAHSLNGGGAAIYVAGITGLWEFGLEKGVWRQVALPSLGDWWVFRVADGGLEAVWTALYHPATGIYAGARFDKKTKVWTIFGASEGFPARRATDCTLVPDPLHPGQSCWLLTRQGTYRYEPQAARWRDRTAEITGGDRALAASKIVSTPAGDAWFALGAASQAAPVSQPGADAPQAALWNRATDTFTRHRPASPENGSAVYGVDLLVESNESVLLGTTRGAFQWNGRTGRWSPLVVPGYPDRPVYRLSRSAEGLWLECDNLTAFRAP